MPTDLPNHGDPGPGDRRIQAMLLTDALATDDAFIVSRVLNEIAVQRGKEDGFGENPRSASSFVPSRCSASTCRPKLVNEAQAAS